jgi:hypothetical protein
MESAEDIYQKFMEFAEDTREEYPPAIEPIYSTGKPQQPINQSINLYQGALEIQQEENVYVGNGIVSFEWLPNLDVKFSFSTQNSHPYQIDIKKQVSLKLVETETSVEGYILRINNGHDLINNNYPCKIVGSLESAVLHSSQDLSYIIFHLANFHQFTGSCVENSHKEMCTRIVLKAENWNITIDSVGNLKNIMAFLRNQGGYAITHVGKIERSDQKPFKIEEAEDLLEALRWFLTFVRGSWTAPILLVGYDNNEQEVWKKFSADKLVGTWKEVNSWFPISQDAQILNDLFTGFIRRWENNTWNESIKLSIHWYLESIALAGAVQGSIILMQTAFELLGWTLLVEDKKIMSVKGYGEKLQAADKLRLLLSQCGISLKIPESLTNLLKVAKEDNWVDGAQPLTEIRNAIVHSNPTNPKKHQKILNRPFKDTYNLGLWYLELVLLHLFDYKGKYFNRVANKDFYNDNIESVPWVKN